MVLCVGQKHMMKHVLIECSACNTGVGSRGGAIVAGADGGGQEARRAGEGTLPAGSLGVHHFQLANVDFLLPTTCHYFTVSSRNALVSLSLLLHSP